MRVARLLGMTAIALCGLTVDARASHRGVDVDIDGFKSYLYRCEGHWDLHVRYDIEIEDPLPGDRFDLIVYLSERGRPIKDDQQRLVEFVIPLDHPSEIDDDELEFEDRLTIELPQRVIGHARKVKVHAMVVYRGDHRPLKLIKRSPKLRRPRRYGAHRGAVSVPGCEVRWGVEWGR